MDSNNNMVFNFSSLESSELREPLELEPIQLLIDFNSQPIPVEMTQGTTLAVVPECKEFVEATEIRLFRADGSEVEGYKAIVNKDNINETYAIPTDSYKIIQHEAVAKVSREAIASLELRTKSYVLHLNEGARVRLCTEFPDVQLNIGKDKIHLKVSVDNSYNTTTGLRLEISGKIGNRELFVGEKFYHRHTQGVMVENFSRNLKKGIETFKTKFAEEFEKMLDKPISESDCLALLDKWEEKKLFATKYISMIRDVIQNNGFEEISKWETVSNVWLFYNIIAEVICLKVESIDTAKRNMQLVFGELSKI